MTTRTRSTVLGIAISLRTTHDCSQRGRTTVHTRPLHFAAMLCALILLTAVSSAFAQIATGRIVGRITDAGGAVVPGARVTLTNAATGVVQAVNSGGGGEYVFEAVNPS